MNALNIAGSTMTSREIAELAGKRHDHVMRDIRNMMVELGLSSPHFTGQYIDSTGRTLPCFNLPKRETLILVSGYNVTMRAKIIDRWQELEAKQSAPAVPQSLPEALRLAADLADQKAQVEVKLALAAPKAQALDRISNSDGAMNPTVAAKTLQVRPKELFSYLREKMWIYRRAGANGNVAYQDKIQKGLLTHKVTTVTRDDGSEKIVEQVLVTAKGLTHLSQAFSLV